MLENFLKRLSEFRVAVQNFIAGENGGTRRGPTMHIVAIPALLSEIQKSCEEFPSADSNGNVKIHSRIRARLEFVKARLGDAIRVCGSDLDLLARYSDGIDYLGKKFSELQTEFPKLPVQKESSSENLQETRTARRVYEKGFDGLMKNSAELRSAVNSFVSSYPKDPGDSIVAYVSGINGEIDSLELLHRRFAREKDELRIPGYLFNARIRVKNVNDYLKMAKIICEYNHLEGRYGENLRFVERKVK